MLTAKYESHQRAARMQARGPGYSARWKKASRAHSPFSLAYALFPLDQTCQIKRLPNSLSLGLGTINRTSVWLRAKPLSSRGAILQACGLFSLLLCHLLEMHTFHTCVASSGDIQIFFPLSPPPRSQYLILDDMGPQPLARFRGAPPCLTPDLSPPGGPWQTHVGPIYRGCQVSVSFLARPPGGRGLEQRPTPAGSEGLMGVLPRMTALRLDASAVIQDEEGPGVLESRDLFCVPGASGI